MTHRPSRLTTRLTALLAVLLVLMLGMMSVCPELHGGLHEHEQLAAHSDHEEHETPVNDSGHECAVTLFAHGVEILQVFCLLMLVRSLARSDVLLAGDEIAAAYPRYWLVPSHAPPVG